MTFVIAAAGTGGHVYPALSVADALRDRGVARDRILFMGGSRFAADAVPEMGYGFIGFELTHLRRSVSLENLRIPIVLRRTSTAMAAEMKRFGARVVLGMSGYVTVPAAMAARRAAIPFVLQEQNSVPGLAARFASRRATKVFLGLPGPAEDLPRSQLVGNPVRPAIAHLNRRAFRSEAHRRYDLGPGGPVLGVMGGSQGARVLNEMVERIAGVGAVGAIVHLTGPEDAERMQEKAARASLPWRCLPHEPEMEYFYSAVDLVLCRAGAMTVTEVMVTGTPAVLVPLARVGQEGNAAVLARDGSSLVVAEKKASTVPAVIGDLIRDERRLAAMSRSSDGSIHAGAADAIAAHLIETADA